MASAVSVYAKPRLSHKLFIGIDLPCTV